MLLFFAISGIWQLLHVQSPILQKLSTIHTEVMWKNNGQLGSGPMWIFCILMALSFIITTLLGVFMAFKFGSSKRAAFYCLALGIIIPLGLVVLRFAL